MDYGLHCLLAAPGEGMAWLPLGSSFDKVLFNQGPLFSRKLQARTIYPTDPPSRSSCFSGPLAAPGGGTEWGAGLLPASEAPPVSGAFGQIANFFMAVFSLPFIIFWFSSPVTYKAMCA